MKKYIIIAAAAIVTSFGIAYASSSLKTVEEDSKCERGLKCQPCKGTGWNKSNVCVFCKGDGGKSSY